MEEEDIREKAYRYVVYSSIGFSLIATLSAGLTLFMANSSVVNFENKMYKDVVFCKVRVVKREPLDEPTVSLCISLRIQRMMCSNK